jgi:hypothetical protein
VSEANKLRGIIRAEMLGKGMPATLVDETLDLAWHARACAMQTLCDVCDRGSRQLVQENALSVALTITAMRVQAAMDEIAAEFETAGAGHYVAQIAVQRAA